MSAHDDSAQKPEDPFLTVVKGSPSDEEVAALVAVFAAARGDGASSGAQPPRDEWGRITDSLRHSWGSPTSYNQRG